MKSLNIVFYGSAYFVLPLLEAVYSEEGKSLGGLALKQFNELPVDSEYRKVLSVSEFDSPELDIPIRLSLVVTQPDRLNRKKIVRNSIAQYALNNKIQLFQPASIKSVVEEYNNLGSYHLGIVAAYGQILPMDLIESHKYGLINWHPSRLPEYRGPTPVQAALLNDDSSTALSWIDVAQKMDSGDIYLQSPVQIAKQDTFISMMNKFIDLGVRQWALAVALKILDRESLVEKYSPKRQQFSEATFCKMIAKDARSVDTSADSETIYNHYRAYKDFPKTEVLSLYFDSKMTLNEVYGAHTDLEFRNILSRASSVETYKDFYVLTQNDSKDRRVFWKAASGVLEVSQVTLPNGKRINFAGFNF